MIRTRAIAALCSMLAASVLIACSSGAANEGPVEKQRAAGLPDNPAAASRWIDLPIHYCVDGSARAAWSTVGFAKMVDAAFARWGASAVNDGACKGPALRDNGVNEITVGATSGDSPDGYEAGVTHLRELRCDEGCDDEPYIAEADIVIDGKPPVAYRLESCVQSTLLHEVGHLLGLDHAPPPSVMQTGTANCPQGLSAADRTELRLRYGSVFVPPQTLAGRSDIARGTILVGDDGTFLGELNCSRFATDDIASGYGRYGENSYNRDSIFSNFGRFTSAIGAMSAYSRTALSPPAIIEDGAIAGYLTKNARIRGGLDPDDFLEDYLYRCS